MKYIAVDANKSLLFAEQDLPEIDDDECLIKVVAIGVNRADLLQRDGKYPAPDGDSPILGLEVAGDIVKCGAKVADWQLNDKVFTLVAGGGYAQYVKAKALQLMPLPNSFTYQQGAASAEVFLTAYQSLFTIAKLEASDKVLIHAGASGVGCAAIQLAKAKQCLVAVTVSNTAKAEACLALGADYAINYQLEDFVQFSKEQVKGGFDIILDVVAGDYLTRNINAAAVDSHIVMLAMLGGRYSEPIDIAKLLMKRLTLTASTLRNRSDSYKAELVSGFSKDFYRQLAQGEINPVIDTIYPWQDAELAHQKMANNENIGKLILTVD